MRWSRLWKRLTLVIGAVSVAGAALVMALLKAMQSWNDELVVALSVLGPAGIAVMLIGGVVWSVAGLKPRKRSSRRLPPDADREWLHRVNDRPPYPVERPGHAPARQRWVTVIARPKSPAPAMAQSRYG
jgi:hypothetical protein